MTFARIPIHATLICLSQLFVQSTSCAQTASCTDTSPCVEDCESACGGVHGLFNRLAGADSIFDELKNRECGNLTYSVGGELRYRFMNEHGRLRPPGGDAEYSLWRFTPYLKMQYGEHLGGFIEGIDASAFTQGSPPYTPVPIDVNRWDFLRYYAELNLGQVGNGNLKYRYGRQFLKYGGQRLLSPLAWSNTFRNFEGHKFLYAGTDWDVDAFMTKSVNGAAGGSGFDPIALDSADEDRWMSGLYSTYKGVEDGALDLYWLYFNERNGSVARMDGERHTLGTRYSGQQAISECGEVSGTWAWEFEGAYQFGKDQFGSTTNRDVSAGMASATVGYTFNEIPWSPSIKGFYYWGSGDSDPTTGTINTFYSMYPLGHAYWGLIDNFNGVNLQDAGFQVSAKPHEKFTGLVAYHAFTKANSGDNVYNIVGAPITSAAASEIGQEIDIVGTLAVSPNFNIQAGYFWFFYDDALPTRTSARQFYLQTTWKF